MKNLIESILSCSTIPTNWDSALDDINREIGISSSVVLSIKNFSDSIVEISWSKKLREKLDSNGRQAYLDGGFAEDAEVTEALLSKPPQALYSELDLWGLQALEQLPPAMGRKIIEPIGLKLRCAAILNTNGPWLDGFFCQHTSIDECNRVIRDPRMQLVLPLIASALSTSRVLNALKMRFNTALGALDHLGLGVVLVDHTGQILMANTEANRIRDLADGLSFSRQGHIVLADARENSQLSAIIEETNGIWQESEPTISPKMSVTRPSGEFDFLMSVVPLQDSAAELNPDLKCAFVSVIDPSRKDVLSSEGLRLLGGLREAEAKVVELLVKGLKPAQIAEARGVSMNTVKTQLKGINQKLRCSSQSDIIRAAAATRIPIKS